MQTILLSWSSLLKILPLIDQEVSQRLASADFLLKINGDKTKRVDIRKDGLDFVGFHFDKNHMWVRMNGVRKFKNRMMKEVFQSIPGSIEEQNSPDRTLN